MIRDQADYARRKKRDVGCTVPLSDEAERVAADLGTQASRLVLSEETKRLEEAMESLDPVHREVIRLRKYEELSFQEIGERLGRSPDAFVACSWRGRWPRSATRCADSPELLG